MVDVEVVGQLVDSMEDAVLRLEKAIDVGNVDEENGLRVFIFDLYKQICVVLEVKVKVVDVKKEKKFKEKSEKKKKKIDKKEGRKRARRGRSGRKNA